MGSLTPVPLVSRVGRILRPLLNAALPTHPMSVRVLSGPARGLRIVIEPQREKSYWVGTHEPAVQKALVTVLRPGMTVWDIGAHAGFFSALCSRRVGASGRVHAFEPGRDTRARLERTIELNGFQNVQVHPCAVGGERAEGILHDVGRSAQATLRPVKAPGSTVEVRTVEDLWDELGPPDVIKIDAEGAEGPIIESGAGLLDGAPVSIVVEIHDDASEEQIRRLLPGHDHERIDDLHRLLRPGTAA
jgi:FkbM family methyltransferase